MDTADRERAFARCYSLWACAASWRQYARTWDDKPSLWKRATARLRPTR
jgi:hypothetical protein